VKIFQCRSRFAAVASIWSDRGGRCTLCDSFGELEVLIVVTLALALALALPQQSAARTGVTLPLRGVLVPGKSLAGVRLGDTVASVKARWGTDYRICTACNTAPRKTWFYTYREGAESLGAAVTFNKLGKVVAVFTLGAPSGWRTKEGLLLGEQADRITTLYGRALRWKVCIGYGALSMKKPGVVTSIYTNGEAVYGFALTTPAEPVCQ
jgi:hypothetical protein